ncbi:hypothetical protein ACFWPQ_01580 [Streptomyces sp. NPDC058464]|uniref:hypothetical protein n=1 Tax=Streptomyces sp. NPDC058464 TaxID=3346511 RepID=UPI0036597C3B
MARLQILELPSGINDERPPFLLVIDEYEPMRYVQGFGEETRIVDEFEKTAELTGARAVLSFRETVTIPANEPPPMTVLSTEGDEPELAGAAEIVYAHERTRLDLCSALLVSGDTTWRRLIEIVGERQRELAGLYRKLDTAITVNGSLTKQDVADVIRHELDRAARMGQRGMR